MAHFDLAVLMPLLPREKTLRRAYMTAELPGDPFGTPEQLQERFHYSRRQLQRIISRGCGTTLTQFLRSRRLECARELLSSTNAPVAQIIEQAGFTAPSHFYREFRAQFGVSPQAYRSKGW